MAASPNTGMTKADMKKLLIRSKKEPVSCAVGVGDDPKLGLLLLHRTKSGRAVEAILKEECPDAKNTRFGTAFVDMDDNPKLVKITLNRPITGMAKRLIKTLKKTGFTKVVILSEDGSEVEGFEEEDDELAADGGDAPAPPLAPGAPAEAPPPPAATQSPEDKAAQAAALARQLATLAAGIPAAAGQDAERKAALLKLATAANVNLKTGNLVYAANALLQLKAALEAGPVAMAGGSNPALATSRLAWAGVRKQVGAELGKLQAALADTYGSEDLGNEVLARFNDTVAPVLARFDERLEDAVDRVLGENDADARGERVKEAKGVVKDCLSFAMTDKLIAELDGNPFVKLDIRGATTGALAALAKAMQ